MHTFLGAAADPGAVELRRALRVGGVVVRRRAQVGFKHGDAAMQFGTVVEVVTARGTDFAVFNPWELTGTVDRSTNRHVIHRLRGLVCLPATATACQFDVAAVGTRSVLLNVY